MEGHASYSEVDYLKRIGETEFSDIVKEGLILRNDEYGSGFRMIASELSVRGMDNSFQLISELYGGNNEESD